MYDFTISLGRDENFHREYRALEKGFRAQAEEDGSIYLPNVEPVGPVGCILIAMEPSLRRWAENEEDARCKVESGFKNFLDSIETQLVHFCMRRYWRGSYHITDMSKGAMRVREAEVDWKRRYDRWFPLLEEEIKLCAAPGARIVAVGRRVTDYLRGRGIHCTRVIHYSPLAASARREFIDDGRRDAFTAFRGSVKKEDVVTVAEETLGAAEVSAETRQKVLGRLRGTRSLLTESREQLLFHYKVKFESIRS